MRRSLAQLLPVPKKVCSINLSLVLAIAGMVGLCALGCEKINKGFKDATWESEDINKMPAVYKPPIQSHEWLDKQGADGINPTNVAGPMAGEQGLP